MQKRITFLLRQIQQTGKIDHKQLARLSAEERELVINLYQEGLIEEAIAFSDSLDIDRNWETLKAKLPNAQKGRNRKPTFIATSMRYAAIFIGVIVIAFAVKYALHKKVEPSRVASTNIQLIQENGESKMLKSNDHNEIVIGGESISVVQNGNFLIYSPNDNVDHLVFNELRVPYGEIFNVQLSDGTKVYLNSGSTLRYPINFIKGQKRSVLLEGEAFFEVTKDTEHPFIVNAGSVDVEVLGTTFNVSNYPDDGEIHTVLVEGSVRLTEESNLEQTTLLKPGFKWALNRRTEEQSVSAVNTHTYTEWMKGEVVFRNATFTEMTKMLERNYNVKIINRREDLAGKRFNASFNRRIEHIEDILESINEIHPFEFRYDEKHRIIIH